MTAAFVRQQGATSVANAGNKIQITYNTGGTAPVNGNVALMIGGGNKGSTISYTDPAGSRYVSAVAQISDGATSGSANGFAETRVLATADAGVLDQWVLTASTANLLGAILEYSGVSTTTPEDVTPVSDNTDLTSLPGITTVTDGCVIVYWALLRSSVTVNAPPSGFTQRVNAASTSGTNDATLYIADMVQAVHGPTGVVAPGLSGTPSHLVSGLIALRPSSTTPTVGYSGKRGALSLSFARKGTQRLAYAGKRGALSFSAARLGVLQTNGTTINRPAAQRGATSFSASRRGQLTVEYLGSRSFSITHSRLGALVTATRTIELAGQRGAISISASRLGVVEVDTIGHVRHAGERGATSISDSRLGSLTTNNVFPGGQRGAISISASRVGLLFVSNNSTGEATIRVGPLAQVTIREAD